MEANTDDLTSPLAVIVGSDGKIAFRKKIKRLALADTFKAVVQTI